MFLMPKGEKDSKIFIIETLVLNFKTLLETLKTIMLLPALFVQNVMNTILWLVKRT
jgi:hypothetical protein